MKQVIITIDIPNDEEAILAVKGDNLVGMELWQLMRAMNVQLNRYKTRISADAGITMEQVESDLKRASIPQTPPETAPEKTPETLN